MSAIPYSQSEFPPFPAVQIDLRYLLGATGPVLAKIDTGATRTIVPKHLLEEVGAIRTGRVASRLSYAGERQAWPIYEVTLHVVDARWPEPAPTTFDSILVLGVEGQAEVLLGRDILAAWKLELDGPNSHYSVT